MPPLDPDVLHEAHAETIARESRRMLRIGSPVVCGVMLIEGLGHVVQTPTRAELIAYPFAAALVCALLTLRAWRRPPKRADWWLVLTWACLFGSMVQHIPYAPSGSVMFLGATLMGVAGLMMGTGPVALAFALTSVAFIYAVTRAFDAFQWLYPAVTLPMAGLAVVARRSALHEAVRRRLAERAWVRQEAELEGLRRSRALAEGVAHHFNNLLMVILTHGSLALEDAPEMSELREDLDAVVRAGRRAAELVEGLVGTAGAGPAQVRAVAASDVFAAPLPARVNVVDELPGGTALRVDLEQVRAALVQVLENAAEVTPEGQPVVLRVAVADGRVQLRVDDTGPGFAPEALEHAFEPFFTTRDPTRSGLGLAFAKGVVERFGGSIWIDASSQAGATVAIALPADA